MDKYCTKCGSENVRTDGEMNYDPNTGKPHNKWWEIKCPRYVHVGEFGGNGHYYEYGDNVTRYPIEVGIIVLIVAIGFLISQCAPL